MPLPKLISAVLLHVIGGFVQMDEIEEPNLMFLTPVLDFNGSDRIRAWAPTRRV
jgi:hypothetical protein